MRENSRSYQYVVVLVFAVTFGGVRVSTVRAQDNISASLARAQSLYYGTQYQESINLLIDLEKRIGNDPQTTSELLKTKLYLGLAYAALDQTDQANSKFVDVCKLDGKYTLNPQDFPAKVISLFGQARANCTQVATRPADITITQLTFAQGKALYDQGEFVDALKYFDVVLALDSKNELAKEYSKLAQQRLQVSAAQAYIEWRTSFDARQFDKAAASYAKVRADSQHDSVELATRIESEYNKIFSSLLNSWRTACASREQNRLDSIRNEAFNVAFGLPFNRAALAEMQQCPSSTNAATLPVPSTTGSANPVAVSMNPVNSIVISAATVPNRGADSTKGTYSVATVQQRTVANCIQVDPVLALVRLKKRVNLQIDENLLRFAPRGIVVSIEIDEDGNVHVQQIAKTNPQLASALKTALEQWKFTPAIVDDQARCVETNFPMKIIQQP